MKKITYKIYPLVIIAGLAGLASSCLKDDFSDFSKVPTIIEFLGIIAPGVTDGTISDAPSAKTIALTVDNKQTSDAVVILKVNQTGQYATSSDITFTLGISQAALDAYNSNQANVTGVLLPEIAYTLVTTGTIKAGKDSLGNPNRTADITLLLHQSLVPTTPNTNYVLPIAIVSTSAGTVSGNYGAILLNFYHNAYDGVYKATGTRYNFNVTADYTGWDNAANAPKADSKVASTAAINFTSTALTVNSTTTTFDAGNVMGAFGPMTLVVDPATNLVTISQGASSLNGITNTPGTTSSYNPATRTFTLYYTYQNLNSDGSNATFRALKEVLVHQ